MPSKSKTRLAKLTRPKLHNVLARARLFALLDEGMQRAITWISGPPGAGKTALAASYLDAKKLRGIWYHLDGGDHDLATFFHYLSQTLDLAEGEAPLPLITPEHLGEVRAFARYYFREFFSRLKLPAVLAFDNYHEIARDSHLHLALEQAAQELPEGASIIVISREEPPAEYARLEAQDRLARVEWSELKLTLDEAAAIAALRFELDAPTLQSLYEVSKGWAAGLTLALERMKRSNGEVKKIQGEALESVFNYFAGQIFKSAEAEVQDFLMRTALLQRTTPEMARELTGNEQAGALLDSLYRRRLFTDRRGEQPYSYQYHDLFRAFLLQQLEQTHPPAVLGELRTSAGRILEQTQRYDEAFALYAAAADWDATVRLTLEQALQLLAQGRDETLRRWVKLLPDSITDANAWLNYWYGISLLSHDPDDAREPLETAYSKLKVENHRAGQLACCSAILLSFSSDLADLRYVDQWIDPLLALLENTPEFLTPIVELQAHAALVYYAHLRSPRAAFFEPSLQRCLELIESGFAVSDKVVPGCIVLQGIREAGRLRDADRIARALEPALAAKSTDPGKIAYCLYTNAWLETSRGNVASALAWLEKSVEVCNSHAMIGPARHVYIHMLRGAVAFQMRDLHAAEAHIRQMETFSSSKRVLERGWASWVRSIAASMRDDWAGAIEFARQELAILSNGGLVFHLYYAHLHLAGGLAGARRYGEAHDAIENARAILVDSHEFRNLADVDFMAAWLALLQEDLARFDACVRAALKLLNETEPHACLWYVDARIMPAVFACALRRDIEPEQVRELIRLWNTQPPSDAGALWPFPLKLNVLGRFEILREAKPLESSRKPAKKPLALLKALTCNGGSVPVAQLLDWLWPDSDADDAAKSLDVALHRLRTLLGANEAVRLAEGRVSLNRAQVWVDAWAFEALCAQSDESAAQQAIELYRGALLPEDLDAPWSVSYRERLHDAFNRLVCAHAATLEAQQRHGDALAWYTRGLEADDLVEAMHQGVMRCNLELGRRADALAAFQRLRRTLSTKLRTLPSAESLALAQSAQEA